MTPDELFEAFRNMPDEDAKQFLNMLSVYLLLNLPDGHGVMLSMAEYQKLEYRSAMYLATKRLMEGP